MHSKVICDLFLFLNFMYSVRLMYQTVSFIFQYLIKTLCYFNVYIHTDQEQNVITLSSHQFYNM